MDIKIITAIIGSSVLSAFVTALFAKFSKDKSDKLKYITEERKRWRDDIRKAAVEIRKIDNNNQTEKMFESIQEAKTFFQVRLNPEDEEDNELLECINTTTGKIDENFDEYVARLLKHDWERVKKETGQNFIKIYYITILIIALIFLLYPITAWLELKIPQSFLKEIVNYRTLLLLTFFPLLLSGITGIWIFSLKKIKIYTKHKTTKAFICSLLKIPYRGVILNSEDKKKNKGD